MNASLEIGRTFYAIGIIAFGIQHLVYGAFVTRVVPKLPAWIPGQTALAYLVGAILIVAGLAIAFRVRLRAAATVLAGLLIVSIATLYLPPLVANPFQGGFITNAFKAVALCGGALVVVQIAERDAPREGLLARGARIGRFLLAAFLIVAGVQHFLYSQFVATLVPAWIPPSQLFWTYVAGVALVVGGAGIIIPRTTRLAAMLVGVMIFLWVPLLHIPRALVDLNNSNETTAVFEALAMSGIAFMIGGLLRDDPAAHRPYSVAANDGE
jgi:uncharacterized membrane protein